MSGLIPLSSFESPRAPWTLERKELLAADPERVWKALTVPEELSRWWCDAAAVDLREGGRYAFEGATVFGGPAETGAGNFEILECAAPERLRFRWLLGGVETFVAYELTNLLENTELRVTQSAVSPPSLWPFTSAPAEPLPGGAERKSGAAEPPSWWWIALPALRTYVETGAPALRLDYGSIRNAIVEKSPIRLQVPIFTFPWIIWHKLTEPRELDRWWARSAAVEIKPGGAFRLGLEGADASCILDLEEGRRLAHDWSWEGGPAGKIEWVIEETDEASIVRLADFGPWPPALDDHRRMAAVLHWAAALLHLKQMSERGVTPRDYQTPGICL